MDAQALAAVKFTPAGVNAKTTSVQDELTSRILARGDVEEAFRLTLENGLSKYSAAALHMRAMLRMRKGDMDAAEEMIDRSLRIEPTAFAWKMAGDCSFLKSQFDRAEHFYRKAIAMDPTSPEAVHDLAVAITSQGRVEESLVGFRKAIELDPRPDFKHHLSIMALLAGHDEEGWELMKYRLEVPGVTGTFPSPEKYWEGQDLTGKVITVRTEQGWGDGIMFASYLPWLLKRAKKVYVFCQRPLLTWFKHYYPECIPWPHDAPPRLDFDYHVNIMCLPRLVKDGYARPAKRVRSGKGVGFCWYGSPTHKADHLRTVPVERFAPLAEALGEKLYCLGYGRFDQQPEFTKYIVENSRDWLETSKIVEKRIGLIITVDTAIAHLGGFLGIETWLLLPKVPDFRWGLTGETTPWYESVKIYRQEQVMNWDPVFERVKQDLIARKEFACKQ